MLLLRRPARRRQDHLLGPGLRRDSPARVDRPAGAAVHILRGADVFRRHHLPHHLVCRRHLRT